MKRHNRIQHVCMKAYNGKHATPDHYKYPIEIERKYDGIRCIMRYDGDGKVTFRTAQNKPIPNVFVNARLKEIASTIEESRYRDCLFDGELIIDGHTFHQTQSRIMSLDDNCVSGLQYVVFDLPSKPQFDYSERRTIYTHVIRELNLFWLGVVTSRSLGVVCYPEDLDRIIEMNEDVIKNWEGLMIKAWRAPYKFGRCTLREGYMFKWKLWLHDIATIVAVKPQEDWNSGPLTLGSIEVEHPKFGRFKIGSGFTERQREIFNGTLLGHTVVFKYMPYGMKDKPRSPIFESLYDKST